MRTSGVLDRIGDRNLQQIVDEAAARFDTPIAAISIIDRDRQVFVARTGIDLGGTERSVSFCAHAIHRPGEMLVVPDARLDRRFATNPLVTGMPKVRFYAGKPLVSRAGYALGALCIVDRRVRGVPDNLFELTLLAAAAERLINDG